MTIHTEPQTQGKGPTRDKAAPGTLLGHSDGGRPVAVAAKQQTKGAPSDTHLENSSELQLHDHHNIPVISEPVPVTSRAGGLLLQH